MTRSISRRAGFAALTLLLCTAFTGRAYAQSNTPKFLKITAVAPKTVTPGKPFAVAVTLTIAAPYHIQANPTTRDYVATEVSVGAVKGMAAGKTRYPKGMETTLQGETLSVYEGAVNVMVTVTPDRTLKPGKITLPVTVHYQGCNDRVCYRPTDMQTTVVLMVGKPLGPPRHMRSKKAATL